MKIKDDMLDKWESGESTVYDIAEHYCTPVENVLRMLGLIEDTFSYELH
jgi:hypothetical protein